MTAKENDAVGAGHAFDALYRAADQASAAMAASGESVREVTSEPARRGGLAIWSFQ
jgi:hypothetical protein